MEFMRKIRPVLYAFVIVALGAMAWVNFISPRLDRSITSDLGHGDYTLMTTGGQVFTQDSLKGPSAVFFGFTHCPDVCPTSLSDWYYVQQEMGLTGEELPVYFVTVDPERDTLENLKAYVEWVPGAQGVAGSREEIDKAIKAFRVYAQKAPLENGGYNIDHSAYVMLFDKNGNFFEPIGYQEDYARVIEKISRLLKL